MSTSASLPSKRSAWLAVGAWLCFIATFPAGMGVGCVLARGQDAAGRGIGIGLGILGVGLLGGILASIFVSYSTIRLMPRAVGKLLACVPWIILVSFYWMALFTPIGDRLAEWLENF